MALIGRTLGKVFIEMTSSSPCKLSKRPFTVCIEGNIGSGKTTFLRHFKKFNNTLVLEEPVELWKDVAGTNLLELMYSNPHRYAFLFQSYVQLTMLQLHTHKTSFPYKVMERSVYSARCFVENMKRTKVLNDAEVEVLQNWYDWSIKSGNIETDLIVYLRTTPEVVYQRMKKRARKEESSVPLEYLKQIHDIHDEWLYHETLFSKTAPVLVLDGNRSVDEMLVEFENCKNHIFGKKTRKKNETINLTSVLSATHSSEKIKANATNCGLIR